MEDAIRKIDSLEDMQTCHQELKELSQDIQYLNHTKGSQNNPECGQQKILNLPILKLHLKNREQVP